ncbi:MAG: chromate efflux transporter [Limnohabitans sp.]
MSVADPHTQTTISMREALWFWFKLGFISFGGPAGQISIMHQALVVERRWISEKRFLHALNYCMLLPGPEAQQLATYLGWLMHKTMGGVLAGLLFILPALFLIMALSWIYVSFGDVPWVAAVFQGIKPAVIAVVIQALHRLGSRSLHNRWMWFLAVASFVAVFVWQVPFPWIVLGAMLTAAVIGTFAPNSLAVNTHRSGAQAATQREAIIDDHTPLQAHAQFQAKRLWRVLSVGAVLWLLPMGLLWTVWGASHTLLDMGWFFSKAALMTFGGAYAVLPYVYQGAVEGFQWLTPHQMIDGLALGESTPGPLIMVVTFVGYVGGHAKPVINGDWQTLSAVLGALVATWFTFLPSFVFILGGGPLVEMTQHQWRWTAPLRGVTAAVVGVMLQLALFFAYHVWWPQGFTHSLHIWAAVFTVIWTLALFRFKWSVLKVISSAAVVGLVWPLLG